MHSKKRSIIFQNVLVKFDENRAELICSIKNFKSDQCATNGVLNDRNKNMRTTLLPAIVKQYCDMSDNEQGKNE
jgi:hypothetical protein